MLRDRLVFEMLLRRARHDHNVTRLEKDRCFLAEPWVFIRMPWVFILR